MKITAAYDPARSAVVIEVTDAPVEPLITRLDVNGRATVRRPGTTYRASGAGRWFADDREHALIGSVRYIAEAGADRAIVDAALEGAPRGPLLSNPVTATPDVAVLQVHGLTGTRTTTSTVHPIIGRPVPVITHDVASSRTGTLVLLCPDYAEARRLVSLTLGRPSLHLRQGDHPGLDLYFTTTSAAAVHAAGRYWTVDLAYIEIDPPAGVAVTAPPWTFATVTGAHSSFEDVHAQYLTWADLAAGRAAE